MINSPLNFPTFKQVNTNDCGPTCLKIVSKYYKKYYNIEYLQDVCNQNNDGVSLYNLRKGSEILGYQSSALILKYEDLQSIDFPCIVYLKNNHYIVIYKCTKSTVYVSDPRVGLNKYSRDDFLKLWCEDGVHGHALILKLHSGLNNEIKQKTNFITLFGVLKSHLKEYKKGIIYIFITLTISIGLTFIFPFITKSLIDVGVINKDKNFLIILFVGQSIFYLFNITSEWLKNIISFHIGSRVKIKIINEYITKVLKLPISFFQAKKTGDIIQRAKDQERIQTFLTSTAIAFPSSCILIILFGIILWSYNYILAFIYLLSTVVYVLWVVFFYRVRKKMSIKYYELLGNNQSQWIEMTSSIEDLKNYNLYGFYKTKWESLQGKLHAVNTKLLNIDNFQKSGGMLLNNLKNLSITYYAANLVISGDISLGELMAIQFILGTIQGPVFDLISFIKGYQSTYISFSRVNEIYNIDSEDALYNDKKLNYKSSDLLPNNKYLQLRGVSFKYPTSNSLSIKNININIRHKKITAIVGASGCGKSTLLKCIQRLHPISNGKIYYGDVNLNKIHIDSWRSNISTIDQESKLINDTILNNVILGEKMDMLKFLKVLKEVCIFEEVEALPNGANTIINENGKGLSTGQKQRILFARSLYKESNILIYDEATNALDSINEKRILENINTNYAERTVLIASHKLSTIRYADYIHVMHDGYIIESGTFSELIEKDKMFCRIFNIENKIEQTI